MVINRRRFIQTASIAALAGLFGNSTASQDTVSQNDDYAVEVRDSDLTPEILEEGLLNPNNIACDPNSADVYFAQRHGYRNAKGHFKKYVNSDDFKGFYSMFGSSESVFRRNSDGVEFAYNGAGDPWGQIQKTHVAINGNREIVVYRATYIDESIDVYDLETRKLKFSIKRPYNFDKDGGFDAIGPWDVKANPVDGNFYFAVMKYPRTIDRLDPETQELSTVWEQLRDHELFTIPDNICFDSNGNMYFEAHINEKIYKISPEGEEEIIEFRMPRNMFGVGATFTPEFISYDSDALLMAGHVRTMDDGVFGGVIRKDIASGDVDPLARINANHIVSIQGMAIDSDSNVFLTTTGDPFPAYNPQGRLVRLKRN